MKVQRVTATHTETQERVTLTVAADGIREAKERVRAFLALGGNPEAFEIHWERWDSYGMPPRRHIYKEVVNYRPAKEDPAREIEDLRTALLAALYWIPGDLVEAFRDHLVKHGIVTDRLPAYKFGWYYTAGHGWPEQEDAGEAYEHDGVEQEIVEGMALAFFASAYIDQGGAALRGALVGEILDQLPAPLDFAAERTAWILSEEIERANGGEWIGALYLRHSGGLDPMLWGHYAAMGAMGHPEGLEKYAKGVRVPGVEFTGEDLRQRYF